jgi:hypothetical protein
VEAKSTIIYYLVNLHSLLLITLFDYSFRKKGMGDGEYQSDFIFMIGGGDGDFFLDIHYKL